MLLSSSYFLLDECTYVSFLYILYIYLYHFIYYFIYYLIYYFIYFYTSYLLQKTNLPSFLLPTGLHFSKIICVLLSLIERYSKYLYMHIFVVVVVVVVVFFTFM